MPHLCDYVIVARETANILTFENGAKVTETHIHAQKKHRHSHITRHGFENMQSLFVVVDINCHMRIL